MKNKSNNYRGTDQEKKFASDMMHGWKVGWPSYIENPSDDYPAITEIAKECARIAWVSLDEEEGYMRIKSGLARISLFCSESINWKTKNLFYISNGLQNVLLQMQAYSKANKAEKEKLYESDQQYNEAKIKRIAEEKKMRADSKKILIELIENWDIINEYDYKVYNDTNMMLVLGYEKAKIVFDKLPEEEKKEIEKLQRERIKRYKEKLKNWDNE